jgi:hypothetical protein
MEVTQELSSEGFFYDVVTTALGRLQVDTTEHTEFYLVGLLTSYARDKRMLPSEPLGMMLLQPREEAGRILVLKEVGDTSLVLTGFFPESIERVPVSAEYFQGLGRVAYRELSGRLSQSALSSVYEELAFGFHTFVEVLAAARSMVSISKLTDSYIIG